VAYNDTKPRNRRGWGGRVSHFKSVHRVASWVVYQQVGKDGAAVGPRCVCDQGEWDAIERRNPGQHTLIQSGIDSEGVAERLARGTSGDPVPRVGGKKVVPPAE
jgi:hypothetical protein